MGKMKQSKKKEKRQKKETEIAKNNYIKALAEYVDIIRVIKAMKVVQKEADVECYNTKLWDAFFKSLLDGDITTMQKIIDEYKNGFLEQDTDKWGMKDLDNKIIADYNEEAYRLVAKEVLEETNFMEELLADAKQAMSECV